MADLTLAAAGPAACSSTRSGASPRVGRAQRPLGVGGEQLVTVGPETDPYSAFVVGASEPHPNSIPLLQTTSPHGGSLCRAGGLLRRAGGISVSSKGLGVSRWGITSPSWGHQCFEQGAGRFALGDYFAELGAYQRRPGGLAPRAGGSLLEAYLRRKWPPYPHPGPPRSGPGAVTRQYPAALPKGYRVRLMSR
jgi:hypothetical protein